MRFSHFCIVFFTTLLLMAGCSTTPKGLRRIDGAMAIPRNAKVGITEFNNCGGGYQEKHDSSTDAQDWKTQFFKKCREMGHPHVFSKRLHLRLEEHIGKRLVTVKSAKPHKPKQVLMDAAQLDLDNIIAGDLLYLGESEKRTVAESLFYVIRVRDSRIILAGGVKRISETAKTLELIVEIANELYTKAYTD